MTFATPGQPALNYFPCRYGTSKLLFRGPRRRLQDDFVVYLGGIDTYGKFVETPFPLLIEQETGLKSVNLGCANVGIDAYLTDKTLMEICARARVTVFQLMGAQNMSNRFYAVHPRRNDRFLHASSLLKAIYREIDFTEFSFTRHMLRALEKASPDKFKMVRQELRDAWVARMRLTIQQIDGPVILLWLANHAPDTAADEKNSDPMFVDQSMVAELLDLVPDVVTIVADRDEIAAGLDEMVFAEMELPAAQEMLGPLVHRRVAETLAPILRQKIQNQLVFLRPGSTG